MTQLLSLSYCPFDRDTNIVMQLFNLSYCPFDGDMNVVMQFFSMSHCPFDGEMNKSSCLYPLASQTAPLMEKEARRRGADTWPVKLFLSRRREHASLWNCPFDGLKKS